MAWFAGWLIGLSCLAARGGERPNILVAISDDQSYPHTSAYGCRFVETPGFDRVAASGMLFRQAFAPTPGCSPTRAALLTGLNAWQLAQAGTHASSFPARFPVYPELLEASGYWVGFTGKGWGPGNWRIDGRDRNPAGTAFQQRQLEPPAAGLSQNDYAANFAAFLEGRPEGAPFCFWFGAFEPHRGYSGEQTGDDGRLATVEVPPFLPEDPAVRHDLLDYAAEIEWFDLHLQRMLEQLDRLGELDCTLVIVTSDNGMSFPRAKANLYEFGIHVPLAICWPERYPGGRESEHPVSLLDVTATVLEAAGVGHPGTPFPLAGKSLLPLWESTDPSTETFRDAVFASRERHSSSRYRSLGYPQRSIRTDRFLLIRNLRPERWPAGAPQTLERGGYPTADEVRSRQLGPMHGGYHDIDACPTLSIMIEQRDEPEMGHLFELAVGRRPEIELYDVRQDPGCLVNLADEPEFSGVRADLVARLESYLIETGDPRVGDDPDSFERYPRYSRIRVFPEPDWVQQMPDRVPLQPWYDEALAELLGDHHRSKDR